MIVLDTSALVAILSDEPERRDFNLAIEKAQTRFISGLAAGTEDGAFRRFGPQASNAIDTFILRAEIRIDQVTAKSAEIAFDAFRRFRGIDHPARLTYGDCFAYALAREKDAPLLFKGGDFRQTDLEPAH